MLICGILKTTYSKGTITKQVNRFEKRMQLPPELTLLQRWRRSAARRIGVSYLRLISMNVADIFICLWTGTARSKNPPSPVDSSQLGWHAADNGLLDHIGPPTYSKLLCCRRVMLNPVNRLSLVVSFGRLVRCHGYVIRETSSVYVGECPLL